MTLIVDANVLIDYADTDFSVLALYSTHVATIQVPLAVATEVDSLVPSDYENFHLHLVEESLDIARTASGLGGGLSYADWICLLTAEQTGATCASNDTPLLNRCDSAGIPRKRSLRLMIDLVDRDLLPKDRADEIGTAIHRVNPFYINKAVLQEFRRAIGK